MSKPVAGSLYYDSDADRPRVDLRTGSKKVLVEGDAGAGSITLVQTGSTAIDVTGGTGPTVTVALDEAELENGGGQEISVAGLGGVLADAQVAGSLRNATTDVSGTAAAAPVAGQVVTATDSTHWTWQTPSPFDGPDDSGHVDNQYFTGTADTLPSGWSLYRDGTGGAAVFSTATAVVATGAPTVGVDPYVPVTASGNDGTKVNFNINSRRRGWFYFQAPAEAAGALRFAFAKKMATALPADFVIITRFSYPDMDAGGSANLNGELLWGMSTDNSGPRGGQVSGGGRAFILLRPDSASTGNTIATLVVGNGTAGGSATRSYSAIANIHSVGTWLKIVRRSNTMFGFVGNGNSWTKIGSAGGVGTGGDSTTLQWWTVAHVNRNDGSDSFSSYIGFDRMLRYDQSSDVL